MVLYGPVCSGMVWYGLVLSSRVPYGPIWSCMVSYGPVWSRMVLYCPIRSCMVQYSPVWSLMVPYDPVWSHMVMLSHSMNLKIKNLVTYKLIDTLLLFILRKNIADHQQLLKRSQQKKYILSKTLKSLRNV